MSYGLNAALSQTDNAALMQKAAQDRDNYKGAAPRSPLHPETERLVRDFADKLLNMPPSKLYDPDVVHELVKFIQYRTHQMVAATFY